MGFTKLITIAVVGVTAAAAVAGAGAAVVSFGVERATVTITPQTRHLDVSAALHGALEGGDFQTQRLQVTLTETLQGAATGAGTTAGRYATGFVVFNHICLLQGTPPHQTCLPTPIVPAGSLVVNNDGLKAYVLLSAVSCFCGESIAVRATKPGAIGNTGPHTIDIYDSRLLPSNKFIPGESVDNPAPITGGIDGSSYPVVQQEDVDTAAAMLRSRMTSDLQSALRTKAGDLHFVADSPQIAISSDRGAGTAAATFQVTASGSLTATAFSDSDVRTHIAQSLAKAITPGWRLDSQVVISDELVASTPDGNVAITGDAAGYEVRLMSTTGLAARLRGLGVDSARAQAQEAAPGSSIDVRTSPANIAWMPMNPAHIEVVVKS